MYLRSVGSLCKKRKKSSYPNLSVRVNLSDDMTGSNRQAETDFTTNSSTEKLNKQFEGKHETNA